MKISRKTFKKISEEYFCNIQKQNKNLDVASALQVGWYIFEDDCPYDDVLENFCLSKITYINDEVDADEFSNAG